VAEDRFVDDFEKVHGPYVLGELTAEEERELERELERHLEGCSPCRRELERARWTNALLRAAVSQAPSPNLKVRVLKRVAGGHHRGNK
jgi:anti-sigma factor RsiW